MLLLYLFENLLLYGFLSQYNQSKNDLVFPNIEDQGRFCQWKVQI